MPIFALRVKMDLENIESITWNKQNQWCLEVQNPMSQEKCQAYFCEEDQMELSGSRGTAHFIKKWEGDTNQSYLKMVDVKKVTGATSITQSDDWVVLFAIECRGLEPVSWMPKGDFNARTAAGTVFEEVDFDGEDLWTEYDPEGDAPVSIQNLRSEFIKC